MKNETRAVFDRAPEPCQAPSELERLPGFSSMRMETMEEPSAARLRFAGLVALIKQKLRQRRNRLALLELTDDQLKDIGISRSQAYADHDNHRRSNSHAIEKKCL